MAEHKSVKKRHKQSLRANLKNRAIKSTIRSKVKQVTASAGKPEAAGALSEMASLLDRAVKRNIMHKKTAARKKSRMAKILNKKAASR